MSRPPNALPPVRGGETAANHEQLSLFAVRSINKGEDTKDMKVPTEEKTNIKQAVRAKKQTNYSAADIQVLEGIAAIRHRPGMYIGSTSTSGLIHLIWEALDNAVDEAV